MHVFICGWACSERKGGRYIHTYIHTRIHISIYIHACIHKYIHTCNAFIPAEIRKMEIIYVHACIHAYTHIYVHAHTLPPQGTLSRRLATHMQYAHLDTIDIHTYIHTY